jgi:hypothetical protein
MQRRNYAKETMALSIILYHAASLIKLRFLVIGPSILVCIFRENQQMHQNDHFNVMLSQTLLHVSAYQRHHHGAHMTLRSHLYVGCITGRTMEYRVKQWTVVGQRRVPQQSPASSSV